MSGSNLYRRSWTTLVSNYNSLSSEIPENSLREPELDSNRMMRGPDFLVIGAQRAGTTWLHRVLQQHPNLWLPPVKELHYFDKLDTKRTILDAKERRRVGFRGLITIDPWFFRYWLMRRSDAWYKALFRQAQRKGRLTGEITPAYATVDEDVLRRIRRTNNDIKLVFIMRDPVERAWSAVNNAVKKGSIKGSPTVDTMIERARSPGTASRSAYAQTIKRVEAVFPHSQIRYCFFEDLSSRPTRLIADLFSFLGVQPEKSVQLPSAVNVAAGSKPIPLEFSRTMARDYLPSVRELCQRFEGPPRIWRDRYEKLLNGCDG